MLTVRPHEARGCRATRSQQKALRFLRQQAPSPKKNRQLRKRPAPPPCPPPAVSLPLSGCNVTRVHVACHANQHNAPVTHYHMHRSVSRDVIRMKTRAAQALPRSKGRGSRAREPLSHAGRTYGTATATSPREQAGLAGLPSFTRPLLTNGMGGGGQMRRAPTHFLARGTALGLPNLGGGQPQGAPTHPTTKTT